MAVPLHLDLCRSWLKSDGAISNASSQKTYVRHVAGGQLSSKMADRKLRAIYDVTCNGYIPTFFARGNARAHTLRTITERDWKRGKHSVLSNSYSIYCTPTTSGLRSKEERSNLLLKASDSVCGSASMRCRLVQDSPK